MTKQLIRMENNRIDRALLKETLAEIEKAVGSMRGVDDINPYRRSLEKDFARMFSLGPCLAVNSGTDALQLALLACGIGPKDSVIIPNLTYIATGLVIKFLGAEAILADANRTDLTLDVSLLEKKIKPSTKAIIAVHMFGHPCDMEPLMEFTRKHGLVLIEDACQALGSRHRNRHIGSFGDFAAFSFSYYKPLSSLSGNGGMITGKDPASLKKVDTYLNTWKKGRSLEDLDRKFHKIGLADVASVKVKLRYFDQIVKSKEMAVSWYEEELRGLPDVRTFPDRKGDRSVRENFHIVVRKRNSLYNYLLKKGVDTELPYTPLHETDLFRCDDDFPTATEYAERGLQLPLYSLIKKEEVQHVTDCIKKFYR